MTDNTKIEWADTTWNPTLGCDRISAGCDNCYAIGQAHIRARNPHPRIAAAFTGLTERTEQGTDWTGRINLLPDRLDQPMHWRKSRRIFVNSLSDLFHQDVPEDFIAQVWTVMGATPQHTYQILTKRHARMRSVVRRIAWRTPTTEERRRGIHHAQAYVQPNEDLNDHIGLPRVLPNVWLGISAEDQKRADLRVPALLDTPAAVRWVSAEPLLGPLDLTRISRARNQQPELAWDVLGRRYGVPGRWEAPMNSNAGLDWVVTGGESGPRARPADPNWFRSLRDQCQAAGVAYLHKQNGEWAPTGQVGIGCIDDRERLAGPPDERGFREVIRRVGKKAAGRELDGQIWDEYPTATHP
ncbi:DUF5131 family protein [Actinomadura litoris]|uniref:DUF5131 family protein n=1 Tax=Actinomadura litoris TaxID=2678616 RepID=UPI001FA73E79|nr:phage Gp37/Gp68 family protein [Actinomadura litoris]